MSNDDKALVAVEQKEVEFYEDKVIAVRAEDSNVYIPVRPICDLLGVAWAGQYERLKRNEVLSELLMSVSVTLTDIDPSSRRPRTSEMICLPLDYIAGFLFGINASRVKPEFKERVLLYQRECYKVLAEAFQEGRLTSEPSFSELLDSADPDVVQAYQIAQAVVQLARNQIMLEARLTSRLDVHQNQLADQNQRLELIEATLGDEDRYITEDQATAINQAIRSIALLMSKKSGRSEFGACWGEFYRKFGVSKYRHLPAVRFDAAMKWLADWYSSLTDEDVPF